MGKSMALRALRSIVAVVAATWALYLVVVHLVIWTPLLRRATNGDPQSLFVSYGAAWSLWPGRVHVNALQVRIRDAGADALVSIDHADASFDLPALLSRRVVVRELAAFGVSVAVRPRFREDELTAEALEGQPEIPGLPDPRRGASAPSKNPFALQLQKVVADPVREVWIGPYRFSGDAHVEGSAQLRPGRELAIGPALARVRSGDLVLAKRPFAGSVRGTARCTVPRFDLEHGTSEDLLRAFQVEVELESDLEDFGFVQRWLAPLGPLRVDGGRGHAKGRVRLDDGALVGGSELELHARRLAAHHPLGTVTADVVGSIEVDGHEARAKVVLTDAKATRRGAESWPLEAKTLALAARTRSVDLSRDPLAGLVVSADLPSLRIEDLALLDALAPDARLSGAATAKLHLDLDPRAKLVKGEASVEAPHAGTTFDGIAVAGKLAASAKLARLHLSTMKGLLESVHLDLDDVTVRAAGGSSPPPPPPPPWWGRFEATKVELDPRHVIADLEGTMRDARPIVYVFRAKGALPAWAQGLLSLDGLAARAHFETGPDRIELDRLTAAGGPFEVGGHLREKGGRREGELYVGNGVLGVKLPLDTGGGGAKPAIGGGPQSAQ